MILGHTPSHEGQGVARGQINLMVCNVYQCCVGYTQWCAAKNVLISAVSSAGVSSAAK